MPGGGQIVLHVQADVVAGNFFAPGLAEGRGPAPVGQHHHIALMSHQQVVPAVAPALGKGALRPSEADFNGGIALGRVELGREQHPGEHVLSVHRLHHPGLGLVRVQLPQQVLVLEGNLPDGAAVHGHQFGGEVHGGVAGEEGAVREDAEGGVEVEPEVVGCEAHRYGLLVGDDVEQALDAFCEGGEVQGPAVIGPDGTVGIVL